jgi:glutamate-ammonia-ligase adenylyltransferase
MLGKDSIQDTTAALTDLAETILAQVVQSQQSLLRKKFGVPRLEGAREDCRFAVLALGKLGAREMNYHSDMDLMVIYENDGHTEPEKRNERCEQTENSHYFTDLAQRIIRSLSQVGPMGRLYQVDMRLRPSGKSGNLVLPLCVFRRYFEPNGAAHTWERQALTRSRIILGEPEFAAEVMKAVIQAAYEAPWRCETVEEITKMRERLEASRPTRDLKRGSGGLTDVEFLVQRFQLEHGRHLPSLRTPNIWQGLKALHEANLIDAATSQELQEGYSFLFRVQSRLRIVHNRSLDAIPEATEEIEKVARRLGFDEVGKFLSEIEVHRSRIRSHYLRLMPC